MEELHEHAQTLAATGAALERFLMRYEEFVALRRRTTEGDRLVR